MSLVVFVFPPACQVDAVLHRAQLRTPKGEELTQYEARALLPDLPFCAVPAISRRPLAALEAVQLAIHRPLVALVPLGERLAAQMCGGMAARTLDEAAAWMADISISDLVESALITLGQWFTWSKRSEQFVTLRFNQPGMATVTYNTATSAHIGIHLDSWDGGLLRSRQRSRVRLCVNAGAESR